MDSYFYYMGIKVLNFSCFFGKWHYVKWGIYFYFLFYLIKKLVIFLRDVTFIEASGQVRVSIIFPSPRLTICVIIKCWKSLGFKLLAKNYLDWIRWVYYLSCVIIYVIFYFYQLTLFCLCMAMIVWFIAQEQMLK